jgi:hypothetical protein
MIYINPPKPSHKLSHTGLKLIKADLRQPTTAWSALVWAYRVENVRAALMYSADQAALDGGASCLAGLVDRVSSDRRGLINGRIDAHEDAVRIEGLVAAHVPAASYLQVVRAAEAGVLPVWDVPERPLRCVPKMKQTPWGEVPELVYPVTGRNVPYLCLIDFTGLSNAEWMRKKEAAVDAWLDMIRVLDLITAAPLVKWRITGLGVARYPWDVAS